MSESRLQLQNEGGDNVQPGDGDVRLPLRPQIKDRNNIHTDEWAQGQQVISPQVATRK